MNFIIYFQLALFFQIPVEFENKQVFYPKPVRAESTHSYNVLHYLIDLDLPMNSRYLSGAVTIAMRSNINNLNRIDLYLLGLGVDSVRVDGIMATYNHIGETLWINLPQVYNQGDSFNVMVGYSGTATGSMGYLWYQSLHPISYTLGCPFAEKNWLPCYDALWDKADYGVEFYITVPESFTVCATGEFLGKTVQQGYATYHWRHNYPISPYLIHFASSIFTTYSDWYHSAPDESLEIKYYFWPEDSVYTTNAFSLTTDMLEFYDSLFGAYPFERYGMDVVSPFYYGGMEHQTTSTILRQWIIQGNFYGMAHELSHQWWGDMITCFGWANVWLNEGFATYCDALYLEKREGHQVFINTMLGRRNAYFSAEASNPHPIYDPPPNQIFSWGHSYCKGSWVLHMIRYLCSNDSVWLNLLSTYRDSFAYKNASTDDLKRITNQVLNGDYTWFFDEWVYQMGYPYYSILWNKIYESPNWRLILDITQIQTIGPAVFHMPLPLGINFSAGDTILTLAIDSSPQHFEFLLTQEPMQVVVDPQNWIIQKNIVTPVFELSSAHTQTDLTTSVARRIILRLKDKQIIKVFDVTGRLLDEWKADYLNYRPSAAGVYFLRYQDRTKKFVIIE
ncbi:MAG: M1 family metallopeptidase [candidate division WOR-3 bacterium]